MNYSLYTNSNARVDTNLSIGGSLALPSTPVTTTVAAGTTLLVLGAGGSVTQSPMGAFDNYLSWRANLGTTNISLTTGSTLTFAGINGLYAQAFGILSLLALVVH